MFREINDARIALGFGVVFVGYAAYLLIDHWLHDRHVRETTRAKLILGSTYGKDRRSTLRSEEGITDG